MKASAFLNFVTLNGLIPEPIQMGKDDPSEKDNQSFQGLKR